jgi:hypothetical protein
MIRTAGARAYPPQAMLIEAAKKMNDSETGDRIRDGILGERRTSGPER